MKPFGPEPRTYFAGRIGARSQSLVEFAIISPLLMLLMFGVIDFGRAIYIYGTLVQGANEGIRVAVRASSPLPSDTDVEGAVKTHSASVALANPCANGPLPPTSGVGANNPPAESGWIFITQPNPGSSVLASPPINSPGGESPVPATGTCSAHNPAASGNYALQVTVRYTYVPITPLVGQVFSQLILQAYATDYTEY